MIRYEITDGLRRLIRTSDFSLNKISKKCNFRVRNICNTNKSIGEKHLDALANFLKFDKERLNLREIKFDYAKNLGEYYYTKPIEFRGISNEFAEFIGIMLGDGNLHKNQLSIVIDKRDLKLKNHIKELFSSLFFSNIHEYERKDKNAVKLYFYNKTLVELLIKFGLKRGDKIKNQIRIPDWIKENDSFSTSCLRGLMLTDGCVYYCKRDRQIYAKFTNHCFNLLNDFQDVAKELGFDFVNSNKYNKALYRKKQVARFINTLNLSDLKQLGIWSSLES